MSAGLGVLVALLLAIPATVLAAEVVWRVRSRQRQTRDAAAFEAATGGLADVAARGREIARADLYLIPDDVREG